jgi:4-amino-4-deoxy-L-arabinose transferase-like glycosyltransferase
MSNARPSPVLAALIGLLILAGAGAVRVWYLTTWTDAAQATANWQVQAGEVPSAGGKPDAEVLIENLKSRGFVNGFRSPAPMHKEEEETAHLAPGYPVFRAATESYLAGLAGFGQNPTQFIRWVQVGLGSLTALLVFLTASRAFRSLVVGLLAGLAAIGHPFWIISTAEMQDGVLATFLVAFVLYLAVRAGQQGGALTALLLGLTVAFTALTRAALLPFAIVVLMWYLWHSRTQNGGWLFALVAFFGFTCLLASWTVRCYQQLGEPVPIVTTAWWHVWVGNNPKANGGPYTPEMALASEREEILAGQPQTQRYSALRREVQDTVWSQPGATLGRRAKAALYFFFGLSEPKRANLLGVGEGSKPENWIYNYLAGTLLACLALAVLGWRWSYGWKSSTPLAIAVIWIPLPYILSHSEALHGPRLPLDAALICLAAMALACFIPGVGRRLFAGEAVAA